MHGTAVRGAGGKSLTRSSPSAQLPVPVMPVMPAELPVSGYRIWFGFTNDSLSDCLSA